jgi:hypothetical protein
MEVWGKVCIGMCNISIISGRLEKKIGKKMSEMPRLFLNKNSIEESLTYSRGKLEMR